MSKQKGIWIDAKRAVIVTKDENDQQLKTIHSTIEKKVRIPGEGKWFTRMGNRFFSFERKKKAHELKDTMSFFREIQNEIKDAQELVLFGPASKKNELEKYLLSNGISGSVIKAVETADSMTDNQVAAWVRKYFDSQ